MGMFTCCVTGSTRSLLEGKLKSPFIHSPDAIVVHQHSFESPEQRKSVQLSDLIIGKVNGIKLIQCGAEVLQNRDFITCRKDEHWL